MSDQLANIVQIAAVTVLLTLLWAASVAFTYWDANKRGATGGKAFAWLALVILLPFLGFVLYLVYRFLSQVLHRSSRGAAPTSKRETPWKRPVSQRRPMPTYVASDMLKPTVVDPNKAGLMPRNPLGASTKYVFAIAAGAEKGREIIVQDLPARIGRGPQASIRLDADLAVSRQHAEIYEHNGMLRIRDLKSAHGTQVNGSRIEDKHLVPGDRIAVGTTVLVVKGMEQQ